MKTLCHLALITAMAQSGQPCGMLPPEITFSITQVENLRDDVLSFDFELRSSADVPITVPAGNSPLQYCGSGAVDNLTFVVTINGTGTVVPRYVGFCYNSPTVVEPGKPIVERINFDVPELAGVDRRDVLVYFLWAEATSCGRGMTGRIDIR